jgi:hypothetical protein
MSDYSDHPLFLAKKESTAYHEAGHCVAAIKLGVGVERVEMFPGLQDDGSMPEGITIYAGDFRDLSRTDAIICFLAGPLAEKRIGACRWQKSSPSDFKRIDNILRGSGLDIKELAITAERLLSQWWSEVELLQSELLHRGVMIESEILERSDRGWRPLQTNLHAR